MAVVGQIICLLTGIQYYHRKPIAVSELPRQPLLEISSSENLFTIVLCPAQKPADVVTIVIRASVVMTVNIANDVIIPVTVVTLVKLVIFARGISIHYRQAKLTHRY